MFGAEACSFISVDDKSRVPIGLTAAHKQAPLMMHLEYEVKLPDHDFVKASRHKLIPSVNAIGDIGPDGEVTYSGPTFIKIRSGKHDSSTASSHNQDLEELMGKKNRVIRNPSLLYLLMAALMKIQDSKRTFSWAAKRFRILNLIFT